MFIPTMERKTMTTIVAVMIPEVDHVEEVAVVDVVAAAAAVPNIFAICGSAILKMGKFVLF